MSRLVGYTSFQFLGRILIGQHTTFSSSTETQPAPSTTSKLEDREISDKSKLNAWDRWSSACTQVGCWPRAVRFGARLNLPSKQINKSIDVATNLPARSGEEPVKNNFFGVFWWPHLKATTTGLQPLSRAPSNGGLYFGTWQIFSFLQFFSVL